MIIIIIIIYHELRICATTTACSACITKTDNYFRYIIIITVDVVTVKQKYTHAQQHQQHTHIPINLVLSHSPASPPPARPFPHAHIIMYKCKTYTRALFLVHRRRRLSARAITRETNSDWRMNRLGRTKRVFHSYIIFYIYINTPLPMRIIYIFLYNSLAAARLFYILLSLLLFLLLLLCRRCYVCACVCA